MIKMMGFVYVSKTYAGFAEGIERNGDSYEHIREFDPKKIYNADCFYQTNLLKPKFMGGERYIHQGSKYEYILNSKKPFLVSESEPFREYRGWLRYGWSSYGWGDGNFNNANVGPERWNKFESNTGIKIKDWHSPGDAILIMGQKEGDSALVRLYEQGYASFYDWVDYVIREIRKYSDRPIIVRPHPRGASKGMKRFTSDTSQYKNVSVSVNQTRGGNQGGIGLEQDLANAYCVVTFNSLSAVEAVTRGIPVYALDYGSMVWPIAHKDFSQIENLKYSIDLQDWKNKIAYTMWNKQEVKSGDMWAHLKGVYFK
jgi:hypothetical protein